MFKGEFCDQTDDIPYEEMLSSSKLYHLNISSGVAYALLFSQSTPIGKISSIHLRAGHCFSLS
jgi:hypothetical protein